MKAKQLSKEQILTHIPHRPPFLFLDEVENIIENESILAFKVIHASEDYFKGHFPSNPIMPGALIIEALAQTSCVLFDISKPSVKKRGYYIGSIKMRFLYPVKPGSKLELFSKSLKMITTGGIFEVMAKVNEKVVAKGEMAFICVYSHD